MLEEHGVTIGTRGTPCSGVLLGGEVTAGGGTD
jgi:hypothetical protein